MHIIILTIFLLAACTIQAQVFVSATPAGKTNVASLLGKRSSESVTIWSCHIRNASNTAITIDEHLLIQNAIERTNLPFSHSSSVPMLLTQARKGDNWIAAGRWVSHLGKVALVLEATSTIVLPQKVVIGLALFSANEQAIQRAILAMPPDAFVNYTNLVKNNAKLTIEAGGAGTMVLFSERSEQFSPMTFEMTPGPAPSPAPAPAPVFDPEIGEMGPNPPMLKRRDAEPDTPGAYMPGWYWDGKRWVPWTGGREEK